MCITLVTLNENMLHDVTLPHSSTVHQHKKELTHKIKLECKYKKFLAARKE